MIPIFICLLLLGPPCYLVTEGCGRVPAIPAPPTISTTTRPAFSNLNGSAVLIECSSNETTKASCYNGGTCYILVLDNSRVPSCICPPLYTGGQCKELSVDDIFPSTDRDAVSKVKIKGILVGVGVIVLIGLIVAAFIIIHKFIFKKKCTTNGRLLQNENHVQPRIQKANNNTSNGNYILLQDKQFRTTSV